MKILLVRKTACFQVCHIILFMFVLMFFMRETSFAIDISDTPPEISVKAAPANFMIILDDSGSMSWGTLCRGSSEGLYFSGDYYWDDGDKIYYNYSNAYPGINNSFTPTNRPKRFWRLRWAGAMRDKTYPSNIPALGSNKSAFNAMYYNPYVKYDPWYGMTDANIPDVSKPKTHPKGTGTTTVSSEYVKYNTISVKYRHYFVWSKSEAKAYLVVLDGSFKYYRVDDNDDGYIEDSEIVSVSSLPEDAEIKRQLVENGPLVIPSYTDELRNFANWYTYSRTRWLAAVGGITHMVPKFSGIKIGLSTIWGRVLQGVVPVKLYNTDTELLEDYSYLFMDKITSKDAVVSGGTPLRRALNKVGNYYYKGDSAFLDQNGNASSGSPLATDPGGICQQNFTLLFTDGYRNTDSNSDLSAISGCGSGNCDNTGPSPFSGVAPYKDAYSYTLADVAMFYYKTDLSPLADGVPTNSFDEQKQQHMVTYTVGFGLDGTLTKYDDSLTNPAHYPNWPNPVASDLTTIDDLWHAAVNGRGEYMSAKDPAELQSAFGRVAESINDRTASAASVAMNGGEITSDLVFYQSTYIGDGWAGDLVAKVYPPKSGEDSTPDFTKNPVNKWTASKKLNEMTYDNRRIVTYNGTAGIPFRYASLSATQKGQINLDTTEGTNIVNYLRGDHSKEQRNGGTYRNRIMDAADAKIGDIVHSSPAVMNKEKEDVIFVGSNNGMLHAFYSVDGSELFAYVPNNCFANLKDLPNPTYSHKYYVDSSPFVKRIVDEHYLVGGLGKGGKGIYCLNVTNVIGVTSETGSTGAVGMVKWEYPKEPVASGDPDLGFTYSRPIIVNTKASGWVVIFGNGYNSTNGKAILYVLDLDDGSVIKKIDTGIGADNGLSTPNVVDVDGDEKADYVYAGDLKGNLWKFDIRSSSTGDWEPAYGSSPLFTAKSYDGKVQSITTRPDVMYHCMAGFPGYMVAFGTGRYLAASDLEDPAKQTVYGIWDYGDDADDNEYLGARVPLSALSNQPSTVSLLSQGIVWGFGTGSAVGTHTQSVIVSSNPIIWDTVPDTTSGQKPDPSNADPNHAGWYFDLPNLRERIVNDVIIRDGNLIIVSTIPSQKENTCTPEGESWLYELNACSGARAENSHLDVNHDSKLDSSDKTPTAVEIDDPDNPGSTITQQSDVTGVYYSHLIYPPAIGYGNDGTESKFMSTSGGGIAVMAESGEKRGIFYWRSF